MALGPSCAPAVVLIVEDEMMLRMRAVDMVEDAGYRPIEALDADEAVAILESRSDIALYAPTSRCLAAWTAWDLRMPCMRVGRRSRSSWCRGN
jgi:CheY-like chemotaxis protein